MTTPNWFDPKLTIGNVIQIVLLLAALVGIYYGILSRLDVQARDISEVQSQVRDLETDNLPTRLTVLENSISINRAARDRQQEEMAARIDRLDATTSARLDKVTDAITNLSNAVAGLTATLKARGTPP